MSSKSSRTRSDKNGKDLDPRILKLLKHGLEDEA